MNKIINKIPTIVITFIFFLIIPLALFYSSKRSLKEVHQEYSLKSLNLCFEREDLSVNACSQIVTSDNIAFNFASSIYDPTINTLIILIFILSTYSIKSAKSVNLLKKEIDELKEKLNA